MLQEHYSRTCISISAARARSPFGFEDDMLEALASGELEAAAATPLSIGYYNLAHPGARMRLVYAYDAVPELAGDLAVGMRRSDQALRDALTAPCKRC